MNNELTLSIILNIVAIAFVSGLYVQQIKSNAKAIEELKKYFTEKIEDIKDNFKEHLTRVEQKQDKHNGIVERTYSVEQSSKSAHKRIDDVVGQISGVCEKIDDLKDLFLNRG